MGIATMARNPMEQGGTDGEDNRRLRHGTIRFVDSKCCIPLESERYSDKIPPGSQLISFMWMYLCI